jgi:SAM-dependent methyltransferase
MVTFWHSLEHMIDPRRALAKAASILKPGGLCVIALPNRDSKGLESAGVRWGWLQEPFVHPYCFSAAALRKISDGSTETLVEFSRDTWDQQWITTTPPLRATAAILALAFRYPGKLFNRLRLERLARCCQWLHTAASESIHLVTYAGYVLLRPFLAGYERGLRGSELVVIFRKRPSP